MLEAVPLETSKPAALGSAASAPVRDQRQRRRARARRFRQGLTVVAIATAAVLAALALRPKPVGVDAAEAIVAPLTVSIEESGRTRVKDRYVVSAPATG